MTAGQPESKRYKQVPVPGGRPHRIRVQLTTEQLQALQQVSGQRGVGPQQLLLEAYFQPVNPDPRALMREVAGVRRILTEEAELLRDVARDHAASGDVWALVQDAMQWRNLQLTELYQWR